MGHPTVLETELDRIPGEYNTVQLHESLGHFSPDDERSERERVIGRPRSAKSVITPCPRNTVNIIRP